MPFMSPDEECAANMRLNPLNKDEYVVIDKNTIISLLVPTVSLITLYLHKPNNEC